MVFAANTRLRVGGIEEFVRTSADIMNQSMSPLKALYGASANLENFGLYPMAGPVIDLGESLVYDFSAIEKGARNALSRDQFTRARQGSAGLTHAKDL
jgi:hypothetical protein